MCILYSSTRISIFSLKMPLPYQRSFRGPAHVRSITDRDAKEFPGVVLAASRADRVDLTVHRCAPFILYFASAKCPADSYSERNKRCLSSPSSSIWLFSLSIPRSLGRESRLRGSCCHLAYYSTPLSSLRSLRGRLCRGFSFYANPLPALRKRTLFFFLVPSPRLVHPFPHIIGPCVRGSFSPFPFFVVLPRDPVTGRLCNA